MTTPGSLTLMQHVPPSMRPLPLRGSPGVVDVGVRDGVAVVAWVRTETGTAVWRCDAGGWHRS